MLAVACSKCGRSQASSGILGHCPYCGHDPRDRGETGEVKLPWVPPADLTVKCGVCKDTGWVENITDIPSESGIMKLKNSPCSECEKGKAELKTLRELKGFYSPAWPTPATVATFAVGDVVRLKSSQPNLTMTVGSVGEASGNAKHWCDWLDSTGVPHHALFDARQLEHMPQFGSSPLREAYQPWYMTQEMKKMADRFGKDMTPPMATVTNPPHKFFVGEKVRVKGDKTNTERLVMEIKYDHCAKIQWNPADGNHYPHQLFTEKIELTNGHSIHESAMNICRDWYEFDQIEPYNEPTPNLW